VAAKVRRHLLKNQISFKKEPKISSGKQQVSR